MKDSKVEGMFAAMPTPFLPDGEMDEKGVLALACDLKKEGLHGLLAGGSTGEMILLSMEERKRLIEITCQIADAQFAVLAGTGCAAARDTFMLCEFAAKCGATANLVLTPYYMSFTQESLLAYYKEVAERSPLPVVVYHYPMATGVLLAPALIAEIAKIDNIIGIKNTDDMDHTANVIALTRKQPRFAVASGYDSLALANLVSGGSASMGVIHNVLPRHMRDMYDCFKAGEVKKAMEINAGISELLLLLESQPYPGPVKAALSLLGKPGGVPRKPIPAPSDELVQKIKSCLERLGVL